MPRKQDPLKHLLTQPETEKPTKSRHRRPFPIPRVVQIDKYLDEVNKLPETMEFDRLFS